MSPRDDQRAHFLRCAIAEVGYPNPDLVEWMPERGCWGISATVPLSIVWRAFSLLAHTEGRAYPDEAEYTAWIAAGSPRPTWWAAEWSVAS